MKRNQADYPVVTLCRLLGVSTSGYYAWRSRPPSGRTQSDARLIERMRTLHQRSRGTYGVPRILEDLQEEGERINHKRVARLMRSAGLAGISRRKGFKTTVRDRGARPAPDLVQRSFTAERPDRLWVADITYVPTLEGFCSSRWSWTHSAAALWAGPWRPVCAPSSSSMRSTWRSASAGRGM